MNGNEVQQQIETISEALNNLPRADRSIIARDLRQFPNGIPDDVIYKPGTWCGKKQIELPPGEEGLLTFLEYTADAKIRSTVKTVAKVAGVISVILIGYVLLGKKVPVKAVPTEAIAGAEGTVSAVTAEAAEAAVSASISTDPLNGVTSAVGDIVGEITSLGSYVWGSKSIVNATQADIVSEAASAFNSVASIDDALTVGGELTESSMACLVGSVQESLKLGLKEVGSADAAIERVPSGLLESMLNGKNVKYETLAKMYPDSMKIIAAKLKELCNADTVEAFKEVLI